MNSISRMYGPAAPWKKFLLVYQPFKLDAKHCSSVGEMVLALGLGPAKSLVDYTLTNTVL